MTKKQYIYYDVARGYSKFREILNLPCNRNSAAHFKRYIGFGGPVDSPLWVVANGDNTTRKLDIIFGPHAHALVTAWWITKDE